MTANGNHGGSSYEETDSLLLFIGSESHATDFASVISNDVNQVFSSYTWQCLGLGISTMHQKNYIKALEFIL